MAKLRDLADFQEKRQKLGGERKKAYEETMVPTPKVKPKPAPNKGQRKGDREGKGIDSGGRKCGSRCKPSSLELFDASGSGPLAEEDQEADEQRPITVPGSGAPTVNIFSLWSSLQRWLLSSSTRFSSFLHSFLHNKPSESGGTTSSLWPITAPYPELFKKGGVKGRSRRQRCRQMAVNLLVLSLSWLHMHKPKKSPRELNRHGKLSAAQWSVVKRFELRLDALAEVGDVGPVEMGRAAVKTEGLVSILHDLLSKAEQLLPSGYASGSAPHSLVSDDQQEWCDGDAGEVIGRLDRGAPILAKEVEPSRLSFPQDVPEFRPENLFSEPHRSVFLDPIGKARTPAPEDQPPRVQVRASKTKTRELLRFLDAHHRLILAPPENIRETHLCGAFALVKDERKDRLILDARPPNELEETLRDWCSTLGSVTALSQIELLPNNVLYMSGTDLRDFYYCFKVSKERGFRNAFACPLKNHQARELKCYGPHLDKHAILYPCLSTLAMGDNQAVELGQKAHVRLGLQARAFSVFELLTTHGKAPRGPVCAGIVIDDAIFTEQRPRLSRDAEAYNESSRRLDLMCEEYLQRGLTPHPTKTFRDSLKAEFWGAEVDGESGVVRPNRKRLLPLLHLTAQTALLKVASVGLLEMLAGSWVSILQIRRRLLSLLNYIYLAQRGREQEDIIQLSDALVQELWFLVLIGPLATADMRAQSIGEVFLSDASEAAKASVRTKVPIEFTRELQRHCLSRGNWSRLLTPWDRWLREHGKLLPERELPDGVPLVSRPIWLAIAEFLPFRMNHFNASRSRKHINLLELESALELERKLSLRRFNCRYALGMDSQVALACLLKGRSSSFRMNELLQSRLGVMLGANLFGNYGFVPSLANTADDPTRGQKIREIKTPTPKWLEAAVAGDFSLMDAWLESLGFDPLRIADLPFKEGKAVDGHQLAAGLIQPLREVQKPDRLVRFDAVHGAFPVSPLCKSTAPEGEMQKREQKEPEGQTKKSKQERLEGKNEPKPPEGINEPGLEHFVGSKSRVAPPLVGKRVELSTSRRSPTFLENQASPLLSAEAQQLLAKFSYKQFFAPGGKRAGADFAPQRAGFIDLYSGRAEVARQISKMFGVWVLTFEIEHGPEQNLLDSELQDLILELIDSGAILGAGAAPECASFSRAVVPPVRDAAHPWGFSDLSRNMELKVARGNAHGLFVLRVITKCVEAGLAYWVENPDGSFLWLLPPYLASGLCTFQSSFRFDMCRFGAAWRKRTRVLTNTYLRGIRELCAGSHSHIQLRGRSAQHGMAWTRVAQTYPLGLAKRLALAMGKKAGLKPGRLVLAASCSRSSSARIGEASNPGPPRRSQNGLRDVRLLHEAPLISTTTMHIQKRVWEAFDEWLRGQLSQETLEQVFLCPGIAVAFLESYGEHLFRSGGRLYELRHLLVFIQQQYPSIRQAMTPAWTLVSKWEALCPTRHRRPLPQVLFQSMFAISIYWGWHRFAGCLLLGMEGIARVGELFKAARRDLVLPMDQFDEDSKVAFMRVKKPKTLRRGKGRVQHLKVDNETAVMALSSIFGSLNDFVPLYPASAYRFRKKWDSILEALAVPVALRPHGGIRGGGAILAYKRGEPISSILWRMRLLSQVTLESYLQELAAENFLVQLPPLAKDRIRRSASLYTTALRSLG